MRLRLLEAGLATGPVVLFVHGWAVSSYLWRHNIGPLADAGCRVIAIDLPGHGLSDAPLGRGDYSLATLTQRLGEVIDTLGVRPSLLVAQSMGGRIAAQCAIERPGVIARLVLFGPVGFGLVPPWRVLAPFLPPLPGALPSLLIPRRVVEIIQRRVHGKLGWFTERDIDEYWAPSQFPAVVRAQFQMLREFAWEPWSEHDVSALTTPTHVIFGTRDRTVRPIHAERLAARLPAGRLTWIVDGGHVVMEEVPARINALLLSELRAPG